MLYLVLRLCLNRTSQKEVQKEEAIILPDTFFIKKYMYYTIVILFNIGNAFYFS